MRSLDPSAYETWLDDRLEAYLDGELPPDEAAQVEALLADDAAAHESLALAEQIQHALRALPTPELPSHVTQAVLAQARHEARAAWWQRVRSWFAGGWTPAWQPALSMAVLATLVVCAALFTAPAPQPADDYAYTTEEVDLALADIKLALGYLSEVGRRTGSSVRDDVLDPHVVQPTHQALGGVRNNYVQ